MTRATKTIGRMHSLRPSSISDRGRRCIRTPAADHRARADRLRWGEASALTWEDIDAAASCNVLRVRRSHVRGDVRNTTKTDKRRIVPFPVELADVLSEHRRRQFEVQQPRFEQGWAFPNNAGKPRGQRLALRREKAVLKHAMITKHFTIHGLRRTAADLLCRAAVDPVAAKAILGHTTDRMREPLLDGRCGRNARHRRTPRVARTRERRVARWLTKWLITVPRTFTASQHARLTY
jgi:integrase